MVFCLKGSKPVNNPETFRQEIWILEEFSAAMCKEQRKHEICFNFGAGIETHLLDWEWFVGLDLAWAGCVAMA